MVLDASAGIEWLLGRPSGARVAEMVRALRPVAVPHLWALETTQVLRRYDRTGAAAAERVDQARRLATAIGVQRYAHEPLLPRVWELRRTVTAYDAAYVALAEVLAAPLVTTDARLARAPGHTADVRLVT